MAPPGERDSERRAAELYRQADALIQRAAGTPGAVGKRELLQAADAAMTAARTELAGPHIDSIAQTFGRIADSTAAMARSLGKPRR